MNVVLVGYRGTGKSEVARILGEKLGLGVVSLDQQLIIRAGKPIPEVVEERGWPGFRDLEEEVVRVFAARDGQIIDCGGGVIEREGNFAQLRSAGPVIWLKARPATIVQRIGGDDQRPSLTGTKSFTEEVVEVLERREPLYERISHHQIDTDELSAQEVADAIGKLIA